MEPGREFYAAKACQPGIIIIEIVGDTGTCPICGEVPLHPPDCGGESFMDEKHTALIHIALFKPEIHPNTGNVARLCAANRLPLHLVGNIGFRIDDRSVRRAGLDYWPFVDLHREADIDELKSMLPGSRLFYFSARAERLYTQIQYRKGDCLVFGPESGGFPEELLRKNRDRALKIPMMSPDVRSLNLATAVGIAAYEALRQLLQPAS